MIVTFFIIVNTNKSSNINLTPIAIKSNLFRPFIAIMGKNKVRVKNKSKGERWAKGQSSSSNPSKTKHRAAAKSRYFGQSSSGEVKVKVLELALCGHFANYWNKLNIFLGCTSFIRHFIKDVI